MSVLQVIETHLEQIFLFVVISTFNLDPFSAESKFSFQVETHFPWRHPIPLLFQVLSWIKISKWLKQQQQQQRKVAVCNLLPLSGSVGIIYTGDRNVAEP